MSELSPTVSTEPPSAKGCKADHMWGQHLLVFAPVMFGDSVKSFKIVLNCCSLLDDYEWHWCRITSDMDILVHSGTHL